MNNSMKNTLQTELQNYGLNATVEEVALWAQSHPIHSASIVGLEGDALYATLMTVVGEYAQAHGAGAPAPKDPTNTQENAAPSKPVLTASQRVALQSVLENDRESQDMVSAKSAMVAVLADKPHPAEWMGSVGKLQIKGDVQKFIENLQAKHQPNQDIHTWIEANKAGTLNEKQKRVFPTLIPTNDQLAELKRLYIAQNPDRKSDPAWFDFDNDAAYQSILATAQGSHEFDVLIAPHEDTGTGVNKVNAWKWATKGYVVSVPSATGDGTNTEKAFTKKSFEGWLATTAAGWVGAIDGQMLSAKLAMVKDNKAATSAAGAAASPMKVTLRVKGNNRKDNPSVRFVHEIDAGSTTKMSCRSTDVYLTLRLTEGGKWKINKVRVPLIWEGAPAWTVKPEYATIFKITNNKAAITAPTEEERNILMQAQIQKASDIISNKAELAAYNVAGVVTDIQEAELALTRANAAELGI